MQSMENADRRILTVTCYGHFASHVNMLVFPALVLPLTGHLGMDVAAVLGLSFWMYMLFGVTALPWGIAADRWGAPPLLFLFHAGAAVCCVAASQSMDNAASLALSLGGLGLFSGIYHPAGLGCISKRVERVSVGLGYNGMFGNLGIALAPLLAGLVNWSVGPAAVYMIAAALNGLGAVLVLLSPRGPAAERDSGGEAGDGQGMVRAFAVLLVAMMLGGVVYRGATVIVPTYIQLRSAGVFEALARWLGAGISENVAATAIASLAYLVGMAGQYAGGHGAERYDQLRTYLVCHVVVAVLAFALSWATDLPLALLVIAYFVFLLGMQPVENTLVARFTPRRFHHAAYGTKFVLTFGVGSLAVQGVAAVERSAGLGAVFPALGVVSVLMVGVIAVLQRVVVRRA